MKRTIAVLAPLFSLLGCGHVPAPKPDVNVASQLQPEELRFGDFVTTRTQALDYLFTTRSDQPAMGRSPGDYVVYRITAEHLPTSVVVTQRVVGRRAGRLMVDHTIDDGSQPIELRVRLADTPQGDRILSVARLEDGAERPFGSARYRQLMTRLLAPIDQQQGMLSNQPVEIMVGDQALPCESTSYRVTSQGRSAEMTVWQKLDFPWRELGGVLRDPSGREIYAAFLIDYHISNRAAPSVPAPEKTMVATAAAEEWEEVD
jgi:hypothetical protein